jgi:hypothetical protein
MKGSGEDGSPEWRAQFQLRRVKEERLTSRSENVRKLNNHKTKA